MPKPKPVKALVATQVEVSNNIADKKFTFTITQIIGIIAFISSLIGVIAVNYNSYKTTENKVIELDKYRLEDETKLQELTSTVNKQSGEINALRLVIPSLIQAQTSTNKSIK